VKVTRFKASVLVFALIVAPPAAAGADRYVFDKTHTQILFFVDHLGFSRSQGEFHDYDGGFVFDPDNWSRSSVQVAIRTASIDMDDYAWDKHLRSKDFFNVSEYPSMTFRGTRLEQTGERTGQLHGELTLLGVTRPVTLQVTFNKAGVHPLSKKYVAGFSAVAVIHRSDFGMSYALPMVGDKVDLRLEVEGLRREES
jgi:polyisoprenoid-binding protein YceI